MHHHPKGAGFTLLEFIVVLAIFFILLGLSLTGLARWTDRVTMDATTSELWSALRLARGKAVSMREDVKFCPITERYECTRFSTYAAMVFVDKNANHVFDPGDLPLHEVKLNGVRLQLRVSGGRSYIRYRSGGDSKEWGGLNICNPLRDAEASRRLVVNLGGRVRQSPDQDGDGLAEDYRGRGVYCPG